MMLSISLGEWQSVRLLREEATSSPFMGKLTSYLFLFDSYGNLKGQCNQSDYTVLFDVTCF